MQIEQSEPLLDSDKQGAAQSSDPTIDTPKTEPIPLAPIPRLLLTPTQAAAALSISPRLLWSKTKIGEIPCLRIGKAVRYSPAALQEWIDRASG